MRFQLRTDETITDGILRLIKEQIDRSLADLSDPNPDRSPAIHQVRKRCKKIRAALRLVRRGLGEDYAEENKRYRDAARRLSDVRDAEAMIETCNALADRHAGHVDGGTIRPVRDRLEERKKKLMGDRERIDDVLLDVEAALVAGRKRTVSLGIEGDGYAIALAGMRKTYARARAAMNSAHGNPTPETFHEWRKRVKYHWYHMRLLSEMCPPVARVRVDDVDKLAGSLGIYHNLCIFRAMLLSEPASFAGDEVLKALVGDIDSWTARIEQDSRSLGRRLFEEEPAHLARRFAENSTTWPGKD